MKRERAESEAYALIGSAISRIADEIQHRDDLASRSEAQVDTMRRVARGLAKLKGQVPSVQRDAVAELLDALLDHVFVDDEAVA